MNDIVNQVKKAPSVKQISIIFSLMVLISCSVKRYDIVDNTYDLKKVNSKSGFTSININSFDFKTKNKISPWISVNNVSFSYSYDKDDNVISPLHIEVEPDGNFNVEISYLRRHTVKVKEFTLKSGDSIVINAYLKEDTRPIID